MGDQWFRSWMSEWILVVIYEDMTPQHGRSVVQVLVVRVYIDEVTYEAITPQCDRSIIQIIVVRVDISGGP